ncbi:MAG: FAD/NAD(P)-binding oxidoreductase [Solirubrobacterales bacterium]
MRVAIVGGGLGGLTCARRLAARSSRVEVHLVDRKGRHDFTPSLPWVVAGKRRRGDVCRPLEALARRGIGVMRAEVEGLDLDRGELATSAGPLRWDELVLAPGAVLAPGEIPGLAEGAHGFYTLEDAEHLRDRLSAFGGGRVLIVVAATPFRSLAAPYEAAFLIEERLRLRGVTAKVDLITVEPAPMALAGPDATAQLTGLLSRRRIGLQVNRQLSSVEPDAREARFADGAESYDLLVAIPPHRPPAFVARSPLSGPDGWIVADAFRMSAAPSVRAIGDVTSIRLGEGVALPKAGVLAQRQAAVVADNLAAVARGVRPRTDFAGAGGYELDVGSGRALGARGDYYGGRRPRIRLGRPSRRSHWDKVLFERRSLRQLR